MIDLPLHINFSPFIRLHCCIIVSVLASEYAKYYFLLRSMLIKSGLGSEDLTSMSVLDVEGARRLQHLSAQYEKQSAAIVELKKVDQLKRSQTT